MLNNNVLNRSFIPATLQMVGATLEEIEAMLYKTGGRITGISSDMEASAGTQSCVKVSILFDMGKLEKYRAQKDAEEKQNLIAAIKQGYGLDESPPTY